MVPSQAVLGPLSKVDADRAVTGSTTGEMNCCGSCAVRAAIIPAPASLEIAIIHLPG